MPVLLEEVGVFALPRRLRRATATRRSRSVSPFFAAHGQFGHQLLAQLQDNEGLTDLFLLSTCGTEFDRRQAGAWRDQCAEHRRRIAEAYCT